MQAPTRRRAAPAVEEGDVVVERQHEAVAESGSSSVIPFLAEVFLSLVFWTVMAEAVPALWYVPMNNMAIDGRAEPMLLIYLAPALLSIKSLREVTWRFPLLNLISVPTLLSLYAPSIITYGSFTMINSGLFLVVVLGQLLHPSADRRERRLYSLILGLIALVIIRFALSSVSPFFTYQSANIVAIVLSIVASILANKEKSPAPRPSNPTKTSNTVLGDIATSAGFGAFLFLNVMFLTEHGVLARWGNAHPFPIGLGMMACLVIGLLLSRSSFVKSWVWYVVAVLSTLSFILQENVFGAVSGYGLVLYLVSIWPAALEELSKVTHHGRGFASLGFLYLFGCLGSIWCVAYNFVPGGFAVREYTPQMVVLYLLVTKLSYKATGIAASSSSQSASASAPRSKTSAAQNFRLFLIGLAVIGVLLFAPAFIKRAQSYNNYDANGLDTSNLRGMIWATHFGYDNFGRPSYDAMLELIKKSNANVISLVESDVMRLFNGNRDMVEWLQEKLHLYAAYGPGTNTHTWGCAMLSAFPFKKAEGVVLPSPDGENACLIDTVLDVNGKDVDVIMAHFGNTEHVRDRKLQTEDSYKRLKERIDAGRRVVWYGYFTSAPGSPNYNRIMSTGVLDTTDDADRYCEYIWYKNLKLQEFKRIAQGDVSDTEIQYASFEPL